MGKCRINAVAKKCDADYALFPEWYWKYGLHDAVILSVSELCLAPDYKESSPKHNCLEIALNSKNALGKANIKKISLYNYRIMDIRMNATEPITLEAFSNVFWLGDSLAQFSDGQYILEIACTDGHSNPLQLSVRFASAEVERK